MVARRDVVPPNHKLTPRTHVTMAGDKSGFDLLRQIQAPAEDPIANDDVEVVRFRVVSEVMQSIDDVSLAAVTSRRCHWVDRPVFMGSEDFAVMLRVGRASDEQHPLTRCTRGVSRQDDLFEYAPVFRIQLRAQAKRTPAG